MASPTDGYEFEQVAGVGEGQGSLACRSSCGGKELDTIEQLNLTELHGKYRVTVADQHLSSVESHAP